MRRMFVPVKETVCSELLFRIRFRFVCVLQQVIDRNMEIVGKLDERCIVCFTLSCLIAADAVLVHI